MAARQLVDPYQFWLSWGTIAHWEKTPRTADRLRYELEPYQLVQCVDVRSYQRAGSLICDGGAPMHMHCCDLVAQHRSAGLCPQHVPAGAIRSVQSVVVKDCEWARSGMEDTAAVLSGTCIPASADAASSLDELNTYNIRTTLEMS